MTRRWVWVCLAAWATACGGDGGGGECRDDEVECAGICVDPAADPDHCGACDVSCGASEVCEAGVCAAGCSGGATECDRACVDTSSDPRHCGGCGVACGSGEACVAGRCEGASACEPPRQMCGEACVDTSSDALHCGACGRRCEGAETCVGGECREPGPPPTALCDPPIEPEDTSAPDTVVGTGTPESCTHAALADAVAAGGVIVFDCGDGPVTIDVLEALQLRTDVDTIIDGGGVVTLDGGRASGRRTRIFEYESPDYRATRTRVVLQGLTLQNAEAPAADFTPQDPANPRCAWGYKDGEGGAIRIRDGRLHVIDCTFRGNRAAPTGPDTGGGAIFAVGALEVVVVGSTFIDNEGSNGGAIGLLQSDGLFYNTVFEGNRATGMGQNFGGASGCPEFNHAEQGGAGGNSGAVGIDGGSVETVEFCGVVFRGNHANELGTVSRTPNRQRGVSTFDRVLFEGNHAGAGGGAVWMQDMEFTMVASAVVGNTSDGLGAGVRIDQGPHGSTILIENTTFHGNVASSALGGGLVFAGEGLIRNCTFAENEAAGGEGYFGAALVAHGEGSRNLLVRNTVFWNNRDDHQWTPMTCSVGNPGTPVPLPGENNVQWPRYRNGDRMIEDNPCTEGTIFADAMLGPLGDNGGPTPSMVPPAGSPALGIGTDCPTVDQRGEPRPASGCAAGAVEP